MDARQLRAQLAEREEQLVAAHAHIAQLSWKEGRAGGGWTRGHAPSELLKWLQLTYEIESAHFAERKHLAESQLRQAKESVCTVFGLYEVSVHNVHGLVHNVLVLVSYVQVEKLKKQQGVFRSLLVAHSSTIDKANERIVQAKCVQFTCTHTSYGVKVQMASSRT